MKRLIIAVAALSLLSACTSNPLEPSSVGNTSPQTVNHGTLASVPLVPPADVPLPADPGNGSETPGDTVPSTPTPPPFIPSVGPCITPVCSGGGSR